MERGTRLIGTARPRASRGQQGQAGTAPARAQLADSSLMPGYYGRGPRLGAKRRGRTAIVYFAGLTALALLFSAAGPSTTASVTAEPTSQAAVPSASLSDLSASAGSRIMVTGSGFEPGSSVRMEIAAKPASASAALAVGATGDINAALVVPAGSRPGWDDVVLRGVAPGGHVLVEELALQVTE